MGKPARKRLLRRSRRNERIIIKMDLREVGCDPEYWIDLAEDGTNGELM